MRIGLFTNNYFPMLGGVPTAVETIRRDLEALGHEVVIVAPRMAGADDGGRWLIRVPAVPAPTYPDFALPLPLGPGLTRRLRALDLDVFHAHHPFLLGASARRLARASGRPFVFTYHTLYDRYAHYVPLLPRQVVARGAIRWSAGFADTADLVLAPSDFVARRLRAQGVRRPIEVLPTGIDLDRFRPGDRADARRTLRLAADDRVLLYVGRLDREKNLEFLLEAIARVRVPRVRLLLVGRGTQAAALRRAAEARGVADRVDLRGGSPPDGLPAYYRAADAFVFASTTETQGLAVLEAMACGLPVVAVRATGIEEVVAEGVSGLLVPEAPAVFGDAVGQILIDRDLAAKLAIGARDAALPFESTALVRRLVALYRWARGEPAWS
ncbi:MAG TPA: glycosyltransferase [Methylomirabilota bacterium]|nr:glycosyltransferase [Methylomirabilota bacterium]